MTIDDEYHVLSLAEYKVKILQRFIIIVVYMRIDYGETCCLAIIE